MPAPFRVGGPHPARRSGPTPFSKEWTVSPPPPERPRRVAVGLAWLPETLPPWFPSERVLAALVVLALVLSTAVAGGSAGAPLSLPAGSGSDSGAGSGAEGGAGDLAAAGDPTATVAPPTEAPTAVPPTAAPPTQGAPAATEAAAPAGAAATAKNPPLAAGAAVAQREDYLLPTHRILTYYGHPHDANMGILGEYEVEGRRDELRDRLLEQAAEYEAADPTRPVLIGFEVIATVAQRDPQPDGSWLLSTDEETIRDYIAYTAANDMLLFLDVQIGRRGVAGEIELVRDYLTEPHVHLAIDPEFAMAEGEIPGDHFGQIEAADVTLAQEAMVALAEEAGIPPKILLVHQFREDMILNKETIAPVDGVQLVVNADGFGPPELKTEAYGALITELPIEFNGVKLFYSQDVPLMSAADILALDPAPDLMMYQ